MGRGVYPVLDGTALGGRFREGEGSEFRTFQGLLAQSVVYVAFLIVLHLRRGF